MTRLFHDQTPREIYSEYLSSATSLDTELGTGVFLIPDFSSDILDAKVQMVKNINYNTCRHYADHCAAFKFIPNKMTSYDDLVRMAAVCPGGACSMGSQCDAPCLCYVTGGPPGICKRPG
jgi:hypothetical protein